MQPRENIEPQTSYKRYGLKISTSDEVRQGSLHFLTIDYRKASRRNQQKGDQQSCLTDKDHPEATSCKPTYHGSPVICNFCSQSAKPAWRLETKWYGKLCRSVVQGADDFGTESVVSVDILILLKQYANTCMAVLIRRVPCKRLFSFWGQRKVLSWEIHLRSRTLTLFLSRRSACPFLNCD